MTIALPSPRQTPYGVLRALPVAGDAVVPPACDVVIVGGGASGIMAAWYLAGLGRKVVVCEKAEIACESSSRAFGWISELLLDPVKMPISLESKRLWQELQAEIGEIGYRREGLAYLAENDHELGFYEEWLGTVRQQGSPGNTLLTREQTRARFPGAARDWPGAILSPSDGSAEPQLSIPLMAQAARQRGVTLLTGCAVRTLDVAGGQVVGVVTEHGRIAAENVLFAGNAWSRLFLGNHGIDVPQLWLQMSMGRTGPVDGPVGCGGQEDWAWRRQVDGGYSLGRLRDQQAPITRDAIQLFGRFIPALKLERKNLKFSLGEDARRDWKRARRWGPDTVSPMERERVLSPRCDPRVPQASMRLNQREFPAMAQTGIVETWAGAITTTPDNMPIAGPIAALPGLWLATGCSYGLTWSPALGKMLAEMITGRRPALDPHPYRYERFFDGSPTPLRM